MKLNCKIILIVATATCMAATSCKKYLDAKPDKSLQIPATLKDLQALLDDGFTMNIQYGVSYGEASADNYYVPESLWNTLSIDNRNAYVWENFNYTNYPNDWGNIYNRINVANTVLDNIKAVVKTTVNEADWNNIKGSALFYRSFAFLEGAWMFCKAYDVNTANEDYGLALRLTSDITAPSHRASLDDTYSQIIKDLDTAISLLPALPASVFRPSASAGFALLARTYLSMRQYDSCEKYAGLALQIKDELMDYNTIDLSAYQPFPDMNAEVLFQNIVGQVNYASVDFYYARADTALYESYDSNDLRKTGFFDKDDFGFQFKGSYSPYQHYEGITTDEVYLMHAECQARLGNTSKALRILNELMITRWKAGTFVPLAAATPEEALQIILRERRKELIFRGLRWMDIKRLNKEGANIELKRTVNGQTYILQPNDNRFALPLPSDIVDLSGMLQNPK